jgi:hypothetical protein
LKYAKKLIHKIHGSQVESQNDLVAMEQPLILQIEDVGKYTLMCTPTEIKELAIGYMYTQRIINNINDIINIFPDNDNTNILHIKISSSVISSKDTSFPVVPMPLPFIPAPLPVIPISLPVIPVSPSVIPANAGIQSLTPDM